MFKNKKVMLIDDEDMSIFLNKIILKKIEFIDDIEIFNEAKKALFYLHTIQADKVPDVIFLDINMPGMNGWEFIEQYQKIKFGDKVPQLAVLTTSLNPKDKIKADNINCVDFFVNKPLSPKDVLSIFNMVDAG